MIVLACLLIAVLSVPIAGGRLGGLGDLRFHHVWLLALGLGLQILIISIAPGGDGPLHQAGHVLSYALAGAFLVLNRRVPFLWLVGSGGLMNFTAIVANDGV